MTFELPDPPAAGEYRVLVVDPPWDQGMMGLARARPQNRLALPFPVLAPDALAELPVARWAAPQSCLWLWATNSRSRATGRPILAHAFDLVERWGFRYYTVVTWAKRNGMCPFGPYRVLTEHVLFAYRGKADWPCLGKLRTIEHWPLVRPHSAKPPEFYREIARWFDGPRVDVFARGPRPGFDSWGLEADRQSSTEMTSQ